MGYLSPNVRRIACFACGAAHDPTVLNTVCTACGLPLEVEIELPRTPISTVVSDEPSLWRYAPVLPVPRSEAVSLAEGWTPLLQVDDRVWVKDESRNPTGSFKARGMTMAVSAARLLGARRLVAPSAGNAAGALAAYGARAGIPVRVAMPEDTPRPFVEECRNYGADVVLVEGTISDAGRWLAEHRDEDDFDVSTLKEPFRVEGKKTMGYELFEQFAGNLPDVVIYPTGGGTGLVGMWKAWNEMETMGWIEGRRPRLVSVQAEGCAPVVAAFESGSETTVTWKDPHTAAYGLRVPGPIGGFLCLRAIRETGGTAVAVPEDALWEAAHRLSASSGIDVCPEGGAAWAAFERLRDSGWINPGDRVVVFNTGTGLKYR